MSARMNNINNDTNNTHSYVLSDKGRGVVEHVNHETTSSPYSDSSQHQRRTLKGRNERSHMTSPDEGLIQVFTLTGMT